MKQFKYILLFAYSIGLIFLGFRPSIKILDDFILPASAIGGWSMYQKYQSENITLTIKNGDETQNIAWNHYLKHGSFTSSAHPKLSGKVMMKFLEFLEQNNPEIAKIKEQTHNSDSVSLHFKITKIIEEKDTVCVEVSKNIKL